MYYHIKTLCTCMEGEGAGLGNMVMGRGKTKTRHIESHLYEGTCSFIHKLLMYCICARWFQEHITYLYEKAPEPGSALRWEQSSDGKVLRGVCTSQTLAFFAKTHLYQS
jgi:hypothetical protein